MMCWWSTAPSSCGIRPVANRLHQQLAERLVVEELPEHVEDLAAKGRALGFQLGQQPDVDITLPRLLRDQVPEVADLLLTDAMDATKPLFETVRVPRQVVVHHQMSPLKVDALPGCVVGHEHEDRGVVHEGLDDAATVVSGHPSVDLDDRLGSAESCSDPTGQVEQRVLELGEDDELPAVPVLVHHQRVIKDAAQLLPLGVLARGVHALRDTFQVFEPENFRLKLLDGSSGRRVVDDLLLDVFALFLRGLVVQLVDVLLVELRGTVACREPPCLLAPKHELLLADASFEPFATALNRTEDGLGG
jgi:hypothetical protein